MLYSNKPRHITCILEPALHLTASWKICNAWHNICAKHTPRVTIAVSSDARGKEGERVRCEGLQEHDNAALRYKRTKHALIRELQQFEHDTGTMPVQIGLLTERITYLTKHTEMYKKDKSSRRGLMILLSRRKKQLKYLRKTDFESYAKVRFLQVGALPGG
jgi:small subunit ribosomal protein S15